MIPALIIKQLRGEVKAMRALYEINQDILACVDDETGEILDSAKLDALQMEREEKLEGVALWIKDISAEAKAVKEEADKLNARYKALENKSNRLKDWLKNALEGQKIKTARCNVYYTHNKRLHVDDEQVLIYEIRNRFDNPLDYICQTETLRKDVIKDALKNGTTFVNAWLEPTESIVIK